MSGSDTQGRLAERFSRQPMWLTWVQIVAALWATGLLVLLGLAYWCAVASLVAGLWLAHHHWPQVRLRYYFTTRRVVLPVALLAYGVGIQYVLRFAVPTIAGTGGGLVGAMVGGVVAAVALGFVIAVYEGRVMDKVFSLVPVEQRKQFEQQLDELDATQRTAEGQAADLSGLDQAAVTEAIEARVIGQDSAVEAVVATAFRRARLAAARPRKPVAVFLLVGATGSGKTELAKALADQLFASRLVRVDCNELATEAGTARLVGAPPGYMGSAEGSAFCREIGRLGTGVILLDEIEKAHPAVTKVIMGLLDEARITEQSTSRTFSARGFLIIATSNAAQAEIGQIAAAEADLTTREMKVKDALHDAGFLPEVLARIDAVFPFQPLSARALARIIQRFLVRFATEAGVELVSCDAELLLDLVTRANKTRSYGVREVIRSVESAVVDGMLAAKDRGATRVAIRVVDGRVEVQPA